MIKGATVVITGGAGFIGTALTRRLAEDNKIRILDIFRHASPSQAEFADHPNVELIRGDVRDRALVDRVVEGADYVVHMASIAGVDTVLKNPVLTMEVSIEGTMNVLRACRNVSCIKRVLDFSTSEVFGSYAFRVQEADVTSLGAVGEARWTYAVSKLATEHLAHNYWKEFGLPTVSIRPFNIYGPGQLGLGAIHAFVVRALKGEPISIHNEGDQIRAWCYIDDIVDAILLSMEKDEAVGETFNVGNARSTVTIYQLARQILRLAESDSELRFVEWDFPDVELRVPDVRKAEKLLGFRATVDLDDGILRTLDWYRDKMGAA